MDLISTAPPRVWRRPGHDLHAVAGAVVFAPRQASDRYKLGLLTGGAGRVALGGALHAITADRLLVVPPGEPHLCHSAGPDGVSYLDLEAAPSLFAEHAAGDAPGGTRETAPPDFRPPFVGPDAGLARAFLAYHAAVAAGASALTCDVCLTVLLARVLRHAEGPARARARGGDARGERAGVRGEPASVRRAVRHLEERYAHAVRLDELAAVAGLSKFHLVRAFRRRVGLTPQAYQRHVRVARAAALLRAPAPAPAAPGTPTRGAVRVVVRGAVRAGAPSLSVVAATVGFADQAHMTRAFRAVLGTTPGRYAAAAGGRPLRGDVDRPADRDPHRGPHRDAGRNPVQDGGPAAA